MLELYKLLTINACNDGGQHKDQQELESKEHEPGGLLGFLKMVQESSIRDYAGGKNVGG